MIRRVKKFFSQYTVDFWVFIISIAVLAGSVCYLNNHSGMSFSGLTDSGDANIYIIILAFTVILCCFLLQPNKKYNSSPFDWFSLKISERFSQGSSSIQLNNYQGNVVAIAAMLVVFTTDAVYQFASGQSLLALVVQLFIIFILLTALYYRVKRGLSERASHILIYISLFLPITFHLVFGGFTYNRLPDTFIWIVISIIFSMFLTDRKWSRLFFKLFIVVLFIEIIIEMRLTRNVELSVIILFVSNVFYIGFTIFASLEIYMKRSVERYSGLENVYKELRDAQALLVQKEKMVTLGQLIAGVAHEINTPIGAIKASAEILEEFNIGRVIKTVQGFTDADIDSMSAILDICSRSIKNMRSSSELRRGRTQMRKYLETIDIRGVDEISSLLARMEICDIEKVENNIDLFKRENIAEILKAASLLLPFLNSVQSVKFASEKITKIVFSLRSFSHMSSDGYKGEFDVVKNIDNVLVLYQNQLKSGIEIIKVYDEYIPDAYGDVDEISQVWTNIIQNAIYAMSNVGKLTIRIRSVAQKVEVSFTDSGVGISPENINNLFTPFYTTKPLGEGSGLGLDICKKVLIKNEGDIEVSSKLGYGTTFTVTLPIAKSPAIKNGDVIVGEL